MFAKRWLSVLLVAMLILALSAVAVLAARQATANAASRPAPELSASEIPQQQGMAGSYRWSYAAKFVCGYVPPVAEPGGVVRGEPVLKPGNYATDINIHNPNYKEVPIRKKVILLVETTAAGQKVLREPESAMPRAFATITLRPDAATMDDCYGLWTMLYPITVLPPTPMPLLTGYLVIISPLDLDVDAVYTAAAPGELIQKATGIAIDVERIPGKRVFIPADAQP